MTLLDGDHVRQMLSSELGFSHEHRNLNVQRIGCDRDVHSHSQSQEHLLTDGVFCPYSYSYVASEIVKPGGAVIAAPIAPYSKSRRAAREMVEKVPLD